MHHSDQLGSRKADHLALCEERDVEHRQTTLLDDIALIHESLPELDAAAIDTRVSFCGRTLPSPLLVTGMTGGIARAGEVNRALAAAAEAHGAAFGVGSQRAMLRDRAVANTYDVRVVAPSVFLLGNIGAVQAAACSAQELADLVGLIGADALCVHLNPAQELVQQGGDRDFRGCIDGIARAVEVLDVPVIGKETGAGMSRRTLMLLRDAGVAAVDVSGAGGTTWVGVEALRGDEESSRVGQALWSWGVPTAASLLWARDADVVSIASGGVRDGLDVARALAVGATLAGAALPFLRALAVSPEALDLELRVWQRTLRTVMALTASPSVGALRRAPRHIGDRLARWEAAGR